MMGGRVSAAWMSSDARDRASAGSDHGSDRAGGGEEHETPPQDGGRMPPDIRKLPSSVPMGNLRHRRRRRRGHHHHQPHATDRFVRNSMAQEPLVGSMSLVRFTVLSMTVTMMMTMGLRVAVGVAWVLMWEVL